MPEPSEPTHLFRILRRAATDSLAVDGQKDDFNYVATWMKHGDAPIAWRSENGTSSFG